MKGYILFRQANLSQVQEDQVTTWTPGKHDRERVIKALRRLEKVHQEKLGKHYVTAEDEGEANIHAGRAGMFPEDEDENFVWINEGDLNEIYDLRGTGLARGPGDFPGGETGAS